jgi:hypothetical protein
MRERATERSEREDHEAVHEPVPIRRAALGCLGLAVLGLVIAGLVRPAIFSLAPARDDGVVTLGTLGESADAPVLRDVILSRSYGYDGEKDAGEGRTQIAVIVATSPASGVTVVNAVSPVAEDCAIQIGADRLVDCDGRAWTWDGLPLDPADPALERWPVDIENGAVVVDFTSAIAD